MSMDKKLTSAVYAAVEKAYDHRCDIEDAADEILEIIKADRKRRGEPVAWRVHPFDYGIGHEGVYALTSRPDQVAAWKRKGWEVQPLYTAPQHAEPIVSDVEAIVRLLESREWAEHVATTPLGQRLETAVTVLVGAVTQPAELVERPLPPLDNLSIAELRELAMRDCSQYSDDDLAIAWELFDRLVEGGRIVDATEPVKRKRRYAQGTALGEFGIIPMCDQVDDEPAAPQPAEPVGEVLGETCIDGGKCHHGCKERCFRRQYCDPFSDYSGPWEYAAETDSPQPSEPVSQHPDDAAVDAFAVAMKAKLAKKRDEGRGNWQLCTSTYLSRLLREHVEKGDPVDVANLAMMLHQNGQRIEPAEPAKSYLKVSYDKYGDCLYVVCDSNEPARSDEDENGILYRYAESDGRLVGITILDFMGRHAKSPDDASQPAEPVEGARVATDHSLPEPSIVWHDSPEGVDRAMWEEAAQDAGLSYEDLRDSVTVGQDENGAPVELTHAQTIDAIRNQGCWGFVDTNTGTIHAWAADDADPMLVVHMLAHEIGHMTGEQHPDELHEEMRAEQFGRVAAMAFRMWRQRWPLTIVEGAQ